MLPRLPPVFRCLARSQQGVTVIEYSLLVALLSVAAVVAFNGLGQKIRNVLDAASTAMS